MTASGSFRLAREQVLRYRARVSHLDRKLPAGSFATAAWGGLQDSVPRAGVISLHARVTDTKPDSWEDPSVVQIWFRGGADYIVPREDAAVFTLGSSPRDPERAAELDRLADAIHRVTEGRTLIVNEVSKLLGHAHQTGLRVSGLTGRVHIRWDASRIWLIPVERPDMDPEDARRALARRFLHWFGPTTKPALARWTGVPAGEATKTWKAIEEDLVEIEVAGLAGWRFMLASDLDALEGAEPVSGVRLLPYDDAFTKLDHELLIPDEALRERVLPRTGQGKGYIPGAILVDGEIVGGWQRQQRKVTLHPFEGLPARVREKIEEEALAFPIEAKSPATVSWD
jgi:winged helix DNA-binding protein